MQAKIAITGEAVHVILEGEIDLSVRPEVDKALAQAMACEKTAIVIDLTAVSFLDSTAIGALVRAYDNAFAVGKGLRVTGASGMVLRVLRLANVYELLDPGLPAVQSRHSGDLSGGPATERRQRSRQQAPALPGAADGPDDRTV
jgi:anti-sigma B factor antagonist